MFGVKLAILAAITICATLLPVAGHAGSLKTLYSFQGGPDGANPQGLILIDGVLYGSTHDWGSSTGCSGDGCGTIFQLDPRTGQESGLYAFQGAPGDGSYDYSGPTYHRGLFYGTTATGGQANLGTVYKFDAASGKETILHQFGSTPGDGAYPDASLIYHGGMLYGTTSGGGSACGSSGCGTIFKVDPDSGAETVLYSFKGGADGASPFAGVIYSGNTLFGTTQGGDAAGDYGTVFKFDLSGSGLETVLHRFQGGPDGAYPDSGLMIRDGILYGTTEGGDTNQDFGTVFQVDTSTWAAREVVLHRFKFGVDGAYPEASVIYVAGFLYGTTVLGGGAGCEQNGCGTVFRVNLATGGEAVVHAFAGGTDGSYPETALSADAHAFFGTTSFGGTGCNGAGCGTVFKISR